MSLKEGKTFILAYRLFIGRRNRFLSANKSSNSNPYLGTFFTLKGIRSKIRQSAGYYLKNYLEYQVFVYEMHIDGQVILINKMTLPELVPDLLEEVQRENTKETKESHQAVHSTPDSVTGYHGGSPSIWSAKNRSTDPARGSDSQAIINACEPDPDGPAD